MKSFDFTYVAVTEVRADFETCLNLSHQTVQRLERMYESKRQKNGVDYDPIQELVYVINHSVFTTRWDDDIDDINELNNTIARGIDEFISCAEATWHKYYMSERTLQEIVDAALYIGKVYQQMFLKETRASRK